MMRGFRAVMLCSCLWGACLSDLKPDVGPLASAERDDVGAGEGGASNGASSGDDNANNAGNSSGGGSDGGGSNGDVDGSTQATDAGQDAGPPKPNGCNIKDSDPNKDVLFAAQIKPIFARCGCHDPASDDRRGYEDTNLELTSYQSLRAGGNTSKAKIVVNGNPCESVLLQKLSDPPPFDERMPLNGPYLTDAERALIADWIVEGAREN